MDTRTSNMKQSPTHSNEPCSSHKLDTLAAASLVLQLGSSPPNGITEKRRNTPKPVKKSPTITSKPPAPREESSPSSNKNNDIAPLDLLRIASSTFTMMFHNLPNTTTTTSTTGSNDNQDTPTKFDVLFGKEKEVLNHVGNKRLRVLVALNGKEYQSCKAREDKRRITLGLIQEIKSQGGRFLKKNDEGIYQEVSHEDVYEKVSHALRQAKDPLAKKQPRKRRRVNRDAPTPEEMQTFEKLFADQQGILEKLKAEQDEREATVTNVVKKRKVFPQGLNEGIGGRYDQSRICYK